MASLSKILPACGFAVGVALVLATSAFKEQPKTKSGDPMYTFEYNAPGGTDYSAASVQNVSNWSYVSDESRCDDHNNKACRLFVPEDYVDNPSSTPTLDASIDIGASTGPTGANFVSSTAAGNGTDVISNKTN